MNDESESAFEPLDGEKVTISADLASEVRDVENGTSVKAMLDEQDDDAEQFAIEFLKKIIRLRGVRIDREHFLASELHKRGIGTAEIDKAIEENPAAAGISLEMLDDISEDSIRFETGKSTVLSFAAGLPGGFAMIGTVPADITQFYVHTFRVMQKLAYIYGWKSFLDDLEDIDDETLGILATFLGLMMGVGGVSTSFGRFAIQVARPAIQKKIASVALTKTAWYLPMKQTLRIIGIQVTKQSFAKTVTKVVPLVGGVVSGGLTFVTLSVQSKRLMKHLRKLPPPNVDAAAYLASVKKIDEMELTRAKAAVVALENAADLTDTWISDAADTVGVGLAKSAAAAGGGVASAAAAATRSLRSMDIDRDGVPDASQALNKMKDVGGAVAGVAGSIGVGAARLFKSKTSKQGLINECGTDDEEAVED